MNNIEQQTYEQGKKPDVVEVRKDFVELQKQQEQLNKYQEQLQKAEKDYQQKEKVSEAIAAVEMNPSEPQYDSNILNNFPTQCLSASYSGAIDSITDDTKNEYKKPSPLDDMLQAIRSAQERWKNSGGETGTNTKLNLAGCPKIEFINPGHPNAANNFAAWFLQQPNKDPKTRLDDKVLDLGVVS